MVGVGAWARGRGKRESAAGAHRGISPPEASQHRGGPTARPGRRTGAPDTLTERAYVEQIEKAFGYASKVLLGFLMEEKELIAHLRCVASSWREGARGPSEVRGFLLGRRGSWPT